jgi:hypothetical protein
MAMGGTGWSGIIADTNPPDSDHWWYKLAEEDNPVGWRFFKQPGGLSEHAENREHLPDQYYERQVAGKDPIGSKCMSTGSTATYAMGSRCTQSSETACTCRSSR